MRALLLIAVLLAGCRNETTHPSLDGRVLWDETGCAYSARSGSGDVTFLRRQPFNDKPSCTIPLNDKE